MQDMARLFCPKCGNTTLEKVELLVGPDGAEQYGVRKQRTLRGTRYSLPKPRGGKKSGDPILREDVLLQKQPLRKPRAAAEQLDVFAPEFTPERWAASRGAAGTPGGVMYNTKGAAALLAQWKHNPNERRLTRSNRRKK